MDERRGEAYPSPHSPPPELIRLLEASDPASSEQAWTAFTNAYSRLLLATARTKAQNHDQAMDRYAYLLEALRREDFHRLRSYVADGRGKFSTWLVVVARRLCLDHDRHRYGRSRAGADARTSDSAAMRRRLVDLVAEQVDVAGLASPAAGDPESDLRAQELRGALHATLDRLEPRDRLLLKLRFDEELSARDIAGLMAFPTPFHVYRRLNAVLDSMRKSLRHIGIRDSTP